MKCSRCNNNDPNCYVCGPAFPEEEQPSYYITRTKAPHEIQAQILPRKALQIAGLLPRLQVTDELPKKRKRGMPELPQTILNTMIDLIKDPHDIDGGIYTIHFRDDGMAEVVDCELQSICIAAPGVAVWIAMILNHDDQTQDWLNDPAFGEAVDIAEEMKQNCDIMVPGNFSGDED